jgi:acyl carrier protein
MTTHDQLINIVKEFDKSNHQKIDSTTKLSSLGMDSLEFLEFHMKLEDELNVTISVEDFLNCNTIDDLEILVSKK